MNDVALLALEDTGALKVLADGVLADADVARLFVAVLIDDGRDLEEVVLGLVGGTTLGVEDADLGAGRAFCGVVEAAGVHLLAFCGAAGAVRARLPPVIVSLSPSGFVAVIDRPPEAPVQSFTPLP